MEGWIKLHRRMLNWEWYDHIPTKVLFIHLLLIANHKENKWQGIKIKRGQVITSTGHLAQQTGLSVQNVRTSLKKLEKTGEINNQPNNQHRLITICNYDSYNDYDKEANKQLTSNQQAANKQLTTNKNDKNDKNDKKGEGEASAHRSLEDRKADFKQEVWEAGKDKYPKAMLKAFFDYWTEAGKGAKKMRFEKEKAFEIPKRLATWAKRDKEFGRANSSPDEPETKSGDIRGEVM